MSWGRQWFANEEYVAWAPKYEVYIDLGDSLNWNIAWANGTVTVNANMVNAYGDGASNVVVANDERTVPSDWVYIASLFFYCAMATKANANTCRAGRIKNGASQWFSAREYFKLPANSAIASAEQQLVAHFVLTVVTGDVIKFTAEGATNASGWSDFQMLGAWNNLMQSFIVIRKTT